MGSFPCYLVFFQRPVFWSSIMESCSGIKFAISSLNQQKIKEGNQS